MASSSLPWTWAALERTVEEGECGCSALAAVTCVCDCVLVRAHPHTHTHTHTHTHAPHHITGAGRPNGALSQQWSSSECGGSQMGREKGVMG